MISAKALVRLLLFAIATIAILSFVVAFVIVANSSIVNKIYAEACSKQFTISTVGANPKIDWFNFTYRKRGGNTEKKVHITMPLYSPKGEIVVSASSTVKQNQLALEEIRLSTKNRRLKVLCNPNNGCNEITVDRKRKQKLKMKLSVLDKN